MKSKNNSIWQPDEIQFLIDNKNKSRKYIAQYLSRSYESIKRKMKRLQLKNENYNWSQEEDIYLKQYYSLKSIKEIQKVIPKTKYAIEWRSRFLNLKKYDYKINEIKNLLLNDLEAFYWIGFLLADGSFSLEKKYPRLTLKISIKDLDHLNKFAKFIKTNKVKIYGNICGISIGKEVINEICEKFDIKPRKTYNPPDFFKYNFTDEQMLSLIIGFIDGDGNIDVQNNHATIGIGLHASWNNNLNYINNFLHNLFAVSQINAVNTRSNVSILKFSRKRITENMKKFIEDKNLPALSRKWGKIHLE